MRRQQLDTMPDTTTIMGEDLVAALDSIFGEAEPVDEGEQ